MSTILNPSLRAMNSKVAVKTRKHRTYKKSEAVSDVAHWCAIYPWYRKLVEDIRDTLADHDSHCGDYHRVK